MTIAAAPSACGSTARSGPAARTVSAFIAAFRGDRTERLASLLAEDCVDQNPHPLQGPGREGVVLKMALFRALHPGARTRTTRLVERGGGQVEARWTTTFASGKRTRWLGRFHVGERGTGGIARFEVWRVG